MKIEKKRITCRSGHKKKVLATFARGGEPAFGIDAGLACFAENFSPEEAPFLGAGSCSTSAACS